MLSREADILDFVTSNYVIFEYWHEVTWPEYWTHSPFSVSHHLKCTHLILSQSYSCLCSRRLTKARRASLSSWWRCLGRCSKRSQSWSIPRGKTETWRRSCCRSLRTRTVELSCNKVRTKEHVEGCRIEGKDDLSVMTAGQAEMEWGRGRRKGEE